MRFDRLQKVKTHRLERVAGKIIIFVIPSEAGNLTEGYAHEKKEGDFSLCSEWPKLWEGFFRKPWKKLKLTG